MPSNKLKYLILCTVLGGCLSTPPTDQTGPTSGNNALLYAVAWKQTAAEYRALYYQGFSLARLRLEQALSAPDAGLPLAVITDLDETLLLAPDYWGYLINAQQDFFDDASWDRWVASNRFVASPGALEFLSFCVEQGIEVFYVTNRDQGEATQSLALANLQALDFPFADPEHLVVLRDTSNKEVVQNRIRETHHVPVLLGDNLNDFSRRFYVTDVDERLNLLESEREQIGNTFIVFPNPTDGHWIRAIFGESEPPPTVANRLQLQRAATRYSWQP